MSSTAPQDLDLNSQLAMKIQPMQKCQPAQVLRLDEFNLFYQPPNDNNFYHVTFKMILQLSENWGNDYDFEFFHQSSDASLYYVTCKLLSHPLIISILNKEFYEIDFDVNDLKRKNTLTLDQKLNLKQSIKKVFPFLREQNLKRLVP